MKSQRFIALALRLGVVYLVNLIGYLLMEALARSEKLLQFILRTAFWHSAISGY